MLGHRGCRLAVTFPEIYDMQVRAIMEAACELVKDEGFDIVPEIMIPLVGEVKELAILRANAVRVADEVIAEYGVSVDLPDRHHDRTAAGGPHRRRDRRRSGILLASAPTT